MNTEFFLKGRYLFIINNCIFCREWLWFIERLNAKLPLNKRIEVKNCTNAVNYGIFDSSIILRYWKYIQSFPILFFGKYKLDHSASREELESFAKALLHEDFEIEEDNPFYFNKQCRFVKSNKIFKPLLAKFECS